MLKLIKPWQCDLRQCKARQDKNWHHPEKRISHGFEKYCSLYHYIDVKWASLQLRSLETGLCIQQFVMVANYRDIKALHYSFCEWNSLWPVDFPHKWSMMWKALSCHGVIMTCMQKPMWKSVVFSLFFRTFNIWRFNSWAPRRCICNLGLVIVKFISRINIYSISGEIALMWMPQDLTGD